MSYKSLIVYQKAFPLAVKYFKITKRFPKEEMLLACEYINQEEFKIMILTLEFKGMSWNETTGPTRRKCHGADICILQYILFERFTHCPLSRNVGGGWYLNDHFRLKTETCIPYVVQLFQIGNCTDNQGN